MKTIKALEPFSAYGPDKLAMFAGEIAEIEDSFADKLIDEGKAEEYSFGGEGGSSLDIKVLYLFDVSLTYDENNDSFSPETVIITDPSGETVDPVDICTSIVQEDFPYFARCTVNINEVDANMYGMINSGGTGSGQPFFTLEIINLGFLRYSFYSSPQYSFNGYQ